MLRFQIVIALVVVPAAAQSAPVPKDDTPPLLIGRWDDVTKPPGISRGLEFQSGKRFSSRTLIRKLSGKELRLASEGRFQVRGRIVSFRAFKPETTDEDRWDCEIVRLTADELVLRWPEGKDVEYRRVPESEPLPRLWR
jgi:hypothetical protein